MLRLRALSGTGGKEPACFLLEASGRRILLDLGEGPIAGLRPDLHGIGRVDAVLISHSHGDHAGALHLLPQIGNPPVHACAAGGIRLPDGATPLPLPLRGTADILGICVTTGRNGHAPGGIWLHLATDPPLLYTGDYSTESLLYAFDPPPAAEALILDASYGDDETPLGQRIAAIDAVLDAGPVLLPVPPAGRGPEIALHLAARGGPLPALDGAMRKAIGHLLGPARDSVRTTALADLERLRADAPGIALDAPAGVMLAGDAQCTKGASAELAVCWRGSDNPAILFTGFVAPGTPAGDLLESRRARSLRWSVHPRLSDNAALVQSCGARLVVPAFVGPRYLDAWRRAFAPAAATLAQQPVTL